MYGGVGCGGIYTDIVVLALAVCGQYCLIGIPLRGLLGLTGGPVCGGGGRDLRS